MSRPQSINASRQTSPVRAERERATFSARPSPTSATFPPLPSIASLTMNDAPVKLAARPGRGKLGKAGKALVNYFHLDISKMRDITSYASEHKEQANGREVRLRITQRSDGLLLQHNARFQSAASNYGNRFYSPRGQDLIKPGELTWTYVVDYFEPEEPGPRTGTRQLLVSVVLKKDGEFVMAPFQAYVNNPGNLSFPRLHEFISMVNTLLGRAVSQNINMATFARRTKFFDLTSGRTDLGGGLEALPGFFKSVRDCENGLFLNINTSACAMIKTGRLDTILDQLTAIPLQHRATALKQCRVITEYSGIRVRTVMGFAPTQTPGAIPTDVNVHFTCPQHGPETVQQHFLRAWPNTPRPNPNALVIDFGNKVYIPADLVRIIHPQPFRGTLSPSQTANMITFACRRPAQNKAMIINTGVPYLRFGIGGGPSQLFGISLSAGKPEMTRVDSRLLPCPSLSFASNKTESNLSTGSWNLRGKKFGQVAQIQSGQITYLDLYRPAGQKSRNRLEFIKAVDDGMRNHCNTTASVQDIPNFQHERSVARDIDHDVLATNLAKEFSTLKSAGVKLVFMLLPDENTATYHAIKKAGDLLVGIQTVCVVRNTAGFLKADVGYIANLMLKVNAKLGGKNWTLLAKSISPYSRILSKGTMIVGADVVHPSGAAMIDAPSIAAIVSTHDTQFCQYSGTTRLQQNRDENKKSIEVILDLRGMLIEQLKFFQSQTAGQLPHTIIYMRDGVSEGQYTEAILDVELPGIQRACGELYEKSSLPKIMIITTLKRHHTRFYQDTDDKTSNFLFDKNGNPMPGFTVDRGIVAKYAADFYNVSHACIQGTTRPCKYVLLYDELKASADEIQMMVYHMCFTFARATKSIGIHPAVRFADLLCDRARLYFRNVYNPPLNRDGTKPVYRVGDGHWPGKITSSISKTMFFI